MQQELLDLVSNRDKHVSFCGSECLTVFSQKDPQTQQLRAIQQIEGEKISFSADARGFSLLLCFCSPVVVAGTLVQLGQMFSQFSVLVQRQGEQIERIDSQVVFFKKRGLFCAHCSGKVEQTHSNIENAQRELLKFVENLSGNRSLIMKLFGVTAGFVVVFVMFFL